MAQCIQSMCRYMLQIIQESLWLLQLAWSPSLMMIDVRCKERETQQTERREYEQRAERCRILRPNVSLTTYMTTHAHKRSMRMCNMPEVAAPDIRQKSTQRFQISYAFSGSGGPLVCRYHGGVLSQYVHIGYITQAQIIRITFVADL